MRNLQPVLSCVQTGHEGWALFCVYHPTKSTATGITNHTAILLVKVSLHIWIRLILMWHSIITNYFIICGLNLAVYKNLFLFCKCKWAHSWWTPNKVWRHISLVDVKKEASQSVLTSKTFSGSFPKQKINMHRRRARRMVLHTLRGGSLRVILELSRSAKLLWD